MNKNERAERMMEAKMMGFNGLRWAMLNARAMTTFPTNTPISGLASREDGALSGLEV
jgi:hypothetical protein